MDCKDLDLDLTVHVFFDESEGGRGVTIVKEDELGAVILVKEGESGGLGEPGGLGVLGGLGGIEGLGVLRGLGGPGSIGNPAKLSLISFNNFITPSS